MSRIVQASKALGGSLVEQARSAAYLSGSARRLRAQFPFFSESWYLDKYPDLSLASQAPIVHYFTIGWQEGRQPHYLFWTDWYRQKYLPNENLIDPLMHFFTSKMHENLAPHPLFDATFYRSQLSADNKNMSISNLWLDYLLEGASKGRSPTPLFDAEFYLAQVDLKISKKDAFEHYLTEGFRHHYSPSNHFDENFYQMANPDVVDNQVAGLLHYEMYGRSEGRGIAPQAELGYGETVRLGGQLPSVPILSVKIEPVTANSPGGIRVNLLIPRLSEKFLTGGPNTALALMGLLAVDLERTGHGQVRLIALEDEVVNESATRDHIEKLTGVALPQSFEVIPARGFQVGLWGTGEKFFATTWSTAQALDRAGLIDEEHPFWYLIQDYEPAFYPTSSKSLLAEQTYSLPHRAIVNTPWLLDFLTETGVGRFADPNHQQSSMSFWPAVDRKMFYSPLAGQKNALAPEQRNLVIYARPTTAPRNLFEIALAALRSAYASGVFEGANWQFTALGDQLPPTVIGENVFLKSVPWVSMSDYANTVRLADVLVSLMASPHPSYPPLEGAVAGCSVVTNTWRSKTAANLAEVLPNVYSAEPDIEAISAAIVKAVLDSGIKSKKATMVALPSSWAEAFDLVLDEIRTSIAS